MDVRNIFFARQLFSLEIKLNFPASKERLSVFVCVLQISVTTWSYQGYFTVIKEHILHKCFIKQSLPTGASSKTNLLVLLRVVRGTGWRMSPP